MKEKVESSRPADYFQELMEKEKAQKRLSQKERLFTVLYFLGECDRNYPFHPQIMNFIERKRELEALGFIITKSKDEFVGRERHTAYKLDKHHIMQETPRKWWHGLW
jgi:hypothetical protein